MPTEITREEYGVFNGAPEPEVPVEPEEPEVDPEPEAKHSKTAKKTTPKKK